jgi:head-tail adaptor
MTKPTNPWLSIDPGQLRHQITVQAQSTTQDSVGQPMLTWTAVRTCSGGLNIVSMRQAFGEGQLTAQESDIWTVRWTATEIKPGMQLTFGGNVWKVQVVSNVLRRNLIVHLLCLQLNAQS